MLANPLKIWHVLPSVSQLFLPKLLTREWAEWFQNVVYCILNAPPPPSPMESLNPQRGSLLVESVLGLFDSTLQRYLGVLCVVLFYQVGDVSRHARGLLGGANLVAPRCNCADGVEVGQRVAV